MEWSSVKSVCVCVREREREKNKGNKNMRICTRRVEDIRKERLKKLQMLLKKLQMFCVEKTII